MAWDKRSFTIPAGTPLIYIAGSSHNGAGIYRIDGLDGYVVICDNGSLNDMGYSGLYSAYTGSGSTGCSGSGTNWLNFKTLGDWSPNTYFPANAGVSRSVRVPYSFTLPSHHPTYIKIQQQQQQQVNNAWSSISSLSVPDVNSTTKESAQSTFNSAQSYYNVAINADSSFTNYDNIISKYNSIKSAYDNIVARDNAYNSLTGLTTPTNTTVQATAKTAKDNATTNWNTLKRIVSSSWSNYNTAKAKYDAIVAGHAATVTRDTRLTKKADKTELNTAITKARVEYTTSYTKGTEDYSSIKSTLTSVNKRLNS